MLEEIPVHKARVHLVSGAPELSDLCRGPHTKPNTELQTSKATADSNTAAGDHKKKGAELQLALNPCGKVSIFKDGEIVMNESMAAMPYLEEDYPDPPLTPKDKPTKALPIQRFHEPASSMSVMVQVFQARMGKDAKLVAETDCFTCHFF